MNLWLQVLLGVAVTDVLVGTGHWIEDTWFGYCMTTPLFADIARDNEMHHYFPRAVCATSYLENVSVSTLLSVPLVALVALALFLSLGRSVSAVRAFAPFLITVYVLFALSALIHRFQHDRDCERRGQLVGHQHQDHCLVHPRPRRRRPPARPALHPP